MDAGCFQTLYLSLASISLDNSDASQCKIDEIMMGGDNTSATCRSPVFEAGTPAFPLRSIVSRKFLQDLAKEKPQAATSRRKSVKFSFSIEADYYGYENIEPMQTELSSHKKQRRYQRRNSKTPAMMLLAMGPSLRL